jgi:hypothetical protein
MVGMFSLLTAQFSPPGKFYLRQGKGIIFD